MADTLRTFRCYQGIGAIAMRVKKSILPTMTFNNNNNKKPIHHLDVSDGLGRNTLGTCLPSHKYHKYPMKPSVPYTIPILRGFLVCGHAVYPAIMSLGRRAQLVSQKVTFQVHGARGLISHHRMAKLTFFSFNLPLIYKGAK